MVIKRGDIWWASLSDPQGSGPGFRRPLAIIQANEFNQSHIKTVIAAVITSNIKLATAPGNLPLPANSAGLNKDSVINVSQLITVDKTLLTEKAGRLNMHQLHQLNEGLRLVLAV
jgi:mRNA interferase MazF